MKKQFSILLVALFAVGLSAFTPQKTAVSDYYYRDDNGNIQVWVGIACDPPTTPCCLVQIQVKLFRIYFDINLQLPVPGPDCP